MNQERTAAILMATYNDWESILELLPCIDEELARIGLSGRVVIVDDGSDETSLRERVSDLPLLAISSIECVDLYRNHGNQRAITIGIAYCAENIASDYLVVMDSDHEDDPKYIPDLIAACDSNDGKKIVFASRSKRSEGAVFRGFYGVYKWLYHLLTGMPISIGNYSVLPKSLIRRVANVAELWSHFPAGIMRAKIPHTSIPSIRAKRTKGESKMNLVTLILHALSGFSVHAEVVGIRVLVMVVLTALSILGLLVVAVLLKMFTGIPILGWTSQIVGLLLIMLFQLFITMIIMVFMVISVRQHAPMIPIGVYKQFIDAVFPLYSNRSS